MYEAWSHLVVTTAQQTLKICRLVSTGRNAAQVSPPTPGVLRVGCYGYSVGLWWPRATTGRLGQSFEVYRCFYHLGI